MGTNVQIVEDEEIVIIEPKEDEISPEGLEVAEAYLHTLDIKEAALQLDLPAHLVSKQLNTREVRKYVDTVFMDAGYRNKYTLSSALDGVIDAKLLEMQDSEMGSTKDIADLLALAHKFRMDEMQKQIEMEKVHISKHKNDTVAAGTINNTQVNLTGGAKYNSLITELLTHK